MPNLWQGSGVLGVLSVAVHGTHIHCLCLNVPEVFLIMSTRLLSRVEQEYHS